MTTNKYGLSRDIPAEVRREVRRRDGFGCIFDGCGIYQYEHVAPEFADATEHNAGNITLLCGKCHDKVTRGILSKASVIEQMKKPFNKIRGNAQEAFDISSIHPRIVFGELECINVQHVIVINGMPILDIKPPENKGEPFRLSGIFHNDDDEEIFRIDDNVWSGPTTNGDIEINGRNIIIRKQEGELSLHLRTSPPDTFIVERINMLYQGAVICGQRDQDFQISTPSSGKIPFRKITVTNCEAGLIMESGGVLFGYNCSSGEVVITELKV